MDDSASPHDFAAESAPLLLAFRHALADPLSGAALKLDLLERRLLAPSGAEPGWVMERIRAAQVEVSTATRLLDLLLRLSEIAAELPSDTSLEEACLAAGVPLRESAIALPLLPVRRRSLSEAVRSVASFAARDTHPRPGAWAALDGGRVTLVIEGPRVTADGRPQRLLDLPHGIQDAEALFIARATAEADGGRLELSERGAVLVAVFSWPLSEAAGAP